MSAVIHWFRRDLRLHDNTALQAALESGQTVIPLFVFDPAILKSQRTGAPRLKFMLRSLEALDHTLHQYDTKLLIRQGSPAKIIPALIEETGAQALYFNRDYTPFALRRDEALRTGLLIEVCDFDDAVILPPGVVLKDDDTPYTVYTPFMKRWKSLPKPEPATFKPGRFHDLVGINSGWLPSLGDLGFADTIEMPEASEEVAQKRLAAFVARPVYHYGETRNSLVADPFHDERMAVSCLSPYLRLGQLSPRQCYWAARAAFDAAPDEVSRQSVETWINELIWREFYIHIMFHFPHVDQRSFRPQFESIEWENDREKLQAWKEGRTGYPAVDAAMRQLQAIGWLPNRARMMVASFLTKDLLIDWRAGELHFMQHLIDGDPAANNGGWQWSAGTGTDAQPYFRIFNPISQSKKFDPEGNYIRHWLPELRDVPDRYIHTPWLMETPPQDYPTPIVDHREARESALKAYRPEQ